MASEKTDEVFVMKTLPNGLVEIYSLNLDNAELGRHWTLPHPFPEHITERDGYFYYLHRDPEHKEARLLSKLRR
jgi:hypothetical protein